MVSSTQMIESISKETGIKSASIALHFRNLREEQIIDQRGRGINAAPMTADHAAKLIIALLSARTTRDSAEAVGKYSSLGFIGIEDTFEHDLSFKRSLESDFLGGFIGILNGVASDELLNIIINNIDSKVDTEDAIQKYMNIKVSASLPDPSASIELELFSREENDFRSFGRIVARYGRRYTPEFRKNLKFTPSLSSEEYRFDFGECRHIGTRTIYTIAKLLEE